MSAIKGNGKSSLAITYLFPKGTGFEGQCELERQVQNTVAKALKDNFPDVHFCIADEEAIDRKLAAGSIDADKLLEIIKKHSYPVSHGCNNIEQGMTISGIEQVIQEMQNGGLNNED